MCPVVLVSYESIDCVCFCEGLVVVQQLLEVEEDGSCVTHRDVTAVGYKLSIVRVGHIAGTIFIKTESTVDCQGEVLEESDFCITSSINCISFTHCLVEEVGCERVGIGCVRTVHTCVGSVTEVIKFEAVVVPEDISVGIPYI